MAKLGRIHINLICLRVARGSDVGGKSGTLARAAKMQKLTNVTDKRNNVTTDRQTDGPKSGLLGRVAQG